MLTTILQVVRNCFINRSSNKIEAKINFPSREMKEKTPMFRSSLGFKYPARRDDPKYNADLWLEDRRLLEGAEGLWRVHDQLYDFTHWVDLHPGGKDWLRLTKGTDITEAFESHHIFSIASSLLKRYYIRDAKSKRNSPFTFKKDGFYKTLQRRIQDPLKTIPESASNRVKLMTDLLFGSYILTAIVSLWTYSFVIGAISGVLLSLTTIAAHNFFHQKDNFRMYYFDLSFLSSREWRISHAMSHHLYTNTIHDLEITFLQPFLLYLPSPNTALRRIVSCLISPFIYIGIFVQNALKRYYLISQGLIKEKHLTELIPYFVPILMYLTTNRTLLETILMWLWIVTAGSFHFGVVGVNAAHHHPELFHDGDTPREDKDWGLSQIAAVADRPEINESTFLVLTNFGDHTIHHLFPTIDHGKLKYLYPVLQETCKEFGVEFRLISQWELIVGQFYQLLRMIPNPLPPGNKWHWRKSVVQDLKNDLGNTMLYIRSKFGKNA